MQPPPLPHHPERTLATVHDEIRSRARLLTNLGYPRRRIESRIAANLTWEHELIGPPHALHDVPGIVEEVCAREAHGREGRGSQAPVSGGGMDLGGNLPAASGGSRGPAAADESGSRRSGGRSRARRPARKRPTRR